MSVVNSHLGRTIESAPLHIMKYSLSSVWIMRDILFLVESKGNSAITRYFSVAFVI